MQGNHKLSGAACQISMFQTWDLNYTASNFIFITSVWIQIVIAKARARSRDTKPHALRTPRTSACQVIIANFEFNYEPNNLTLFVKFSIINAYDNKSAFCSCHTCKDWLTERGILLDAQLGWGSAVAQWLRRCATNREVAGSIPDGVIGIFHWHNLSYRTMALGSTQPLTEMSTRSISWG